MPRRIFITGGTGYLGRYLIPKLLGAGHEVAALVRAGSERKLPSGCRTVVGDALDQTTFAAQVKPADTFIQLVGVPHPSPAKAAQFRTIDLVAVRESIAAAVASGIQHFIYLSVAQPAPIMKAYLAVRAEGEATIRASGLNATFVRPFYVLGPGHRWPYLLLPIFWLFGAVPATSESARRLRPVTLEETLRALVYAVAHPPAGVRMLEAEQIRHLLPAEP
jgi:uncharacterized protein YbjT (DUF2867 family)